MYFFAKIFFFIILFFNISVQAFPIPENKKVTYEIIRKNKVIGTHEITFSENNGNLNVSTYINIEVKILFMTAYKFYHESEENWADGNFINFKGYTDFEDEREYFVKGEVKDGFLFASGMDGELKLDKNLIPSNYWNQDVMYKDEIFDTQKGIVRKLDVKRIGEESIEINNKKIICTKFLLKATKHPKDKGLFPEYTLWYSDDKELMKFKFINPKDKKLVIFTRKQ